MSPVPLASATPSDIRDIRGPIAIGNDWLLPAAIAAGVVLLALLLAWAIRRWRRRPRTIRVPPPEEIALDRLNAARALLDPARAREFASAVTGAVRFYLEARFGVAAPRRTTEEFLHDLLARADVALAGHQPLLEDLLRRNDLVKFARAPLATSEMQAMLDTAIRFVRESGAREDAEAASRKSRRARGAGAPEASA
jgi:hypothetical protein